MSTETDPDILRADAVLRLYHFYRIVIGLALVLLISSDLDQHWLRTVDGQLFRQASWAYLAANTVLAAFHRPLRRHAFTLALIDIIALGGLFFLAGGITSGMGSLLVVTVGVSNVLIRGRRGLLIAALAAIALLLATIYLDLRRGDGGSGYVQAAGLGTLCFATALLVQGLVRRLLDSQALAETRATTVAELEALNALILERMRTGILVFDAEYQVLLANPAARRLLGVDDDGSITPLSSVLAQRLEEWERNPSIRPAALRAYANGPLLQPTFARLQQGEGERVLTFLEDVSRIAQQAQQLKLASLGRLTAGIAHEIRNPLGAISHAAQLLQESEELTTPDRRLAQIIQDQSRRMNRVVENVLQLSRRRQSAPQLIDLRYWAHRFAGELRPTLPADQKIHVKAEPGTLQTHMDPHQLGQILTNLVQNGLRYSVTGQVWLSVYRDPDSDLPILDVVDDGPGVAAEQLDHLFEPFFTTENKGTGLGLYISRELCESNQARLGYHPLASGSCFRITFAHPRTMS
ncbi:histidine kinase [Pseudomonas oryzihabitans]|uniref:sensor histidine kinase n=1 Tax=Pseudomonas rhizoryzae TaxID=2571129 RepID=UPI000736E727|nr:ATP-binding protein [Pseudomonas rhizoryzae]APQ11750.1 PAS domain-containing sensor histidine kinase [Pseudomonas psychrotolerans]KTS74840.1 histidine kinase [Pseudomonas psychrotolerans]KTT04975.1 histidine kinase [Pseudomonas psychrotolerans]KTT13467.1 histidine kinase [Pseudomonas psychrotolerans]KTT30125.1 histidine kinase [Pseudomonas psychrotolerans]